MSGLMLIRSVDSGFRGSSNCSPSASESEDGLQSPKLDAIKCKICGDNAQGHHFGAYSCHACGAFFRRSVSNQQQYSCARNQSCRVGRGHSRGMCKACRFKRCIAENMRIQAIVVRTTDELRSFDPNSSLKQIYLAQRGTFVNRFSISLKNCGGNKSLVRIGIENPHYSDVMRTLFTEFFVLQQYFREAGFLEFGFNPLELKTLTGSIFSAWVCYQCLVTTLKNSGHKRNISYFVGESHLKIEHQVLSNYVSTFDCIHDHDLAVKHTIEYYKLVLEYVERISLLRTEDYENAMIFQLFALKMASTMFPKKRSELKLAIDRIFLDLKRQYSQTYDNVALRLGNLILFLSELEGATRAGAEYIAILHLNGYNSVLPKLAN